MVLGLWHRVLVLLEWGGGPRPQHLLLLLLLLEVHVLEVEVVLLPDDALQRGPVLPQQLVHGDVHGEARTQQGVHYDVGGNVLQAHSHLLLLLLLRLLLLVLHWVVANPCPEWDSWHALDFCRLGRSTGFRVY